MLNYSFSKLYNRHNNIPKETKKVEGDKKTPKGLYNIGELYFRKDKIISKN